MEPGEIVRFLCESALPSLKWFLKTTLNIIGWTLLRCAVCASMHSHLFACGGAQKSVLEPMPSSSKEREDHAWGIYSRGLL